MRYLGIDYGTKKVGIALSDDAGTMGFPEGTLPNDKVLIDSVIALITHEKVEGVVLGESKDFAGNDNPVANEARAFAQELEERTGLTVHFEPEVLTTQAARRFPDGSRMEGSPSVDAAAAALILTSFLEKQQPPHKEHYDHD